MKFVDLIRRFSALTEKEQYQLDQCKEFLTEKNQKTAENLLKQKKAKIVLKEAHVFSFGKSYPKLKDISNDIEIAEFIRESNQKIQEKLEEYFFGEIKKHAHSVFSAIIATNLVGLDQIKEAVALQLFSSDPVHILLLGDPGTGKTVFLQSADLIHPISSFGLGSGTSGVGLAVTVKGTEVLPGLIPRAHCGICCIDELNLMKYDDRAALYSAMEKQFIRYDKGGKHYQFDAKVRVLATANPKGDRFSSKSISGLKKQLPFDSALLSRFHLVFLVRKPDMDGFMKITKGILSEEKKEIKKHDMTFIQKYIKEAEKIDPEIPSHIEHGIEKLVEGLKREEDTYVTEITPRTVVGIMRLVKASARMDMRETVEVRDLQVVKDILKASLKVV